MTWFVNWDVKTTEQTDSLYVSPVKRICVFKHSVMTNFNCACPAIQRGQGSGFLSEGSSWLTACMSDQRRFWRDCADAISTKFAWRGPCIKQCTCINLKLKYWLCTWWFEFCEFQMIIYTSCTLLKCLVRDLYYMLVNRCLSKTFSLNTLSDFS